MLLRKDKDLVFEVHRSFKGEFLSPIIDNLKDKYTHHFDDYDEVYHCNKLIHDILKMKDVTLDFHTLYKNNQCVGIALISYGQLDDVYFLGQENLIDHKEAAIVLNYFHISVTGRGNGSTWLNEIILPHYKNLGKTELYIKSTHPKVFSLYGRIGKKIGDYTTQSDNHQFIRNGQLFKITL